MDGMAYNDRAVVFLSPAFYHLNVLPAHGRDRIALPPEVTGKDGLCL